MLPARLFGFKDTGAKIEVLLPKRINLKDWEVIARPFKRLKEGIRITFSQNLSCTILKKEDYGSCIVIRLYTLK